MAIRGDLRTMPLPELLQWAGVNKKTGVLELERNKICRRITFREGRIVACSSDDPASLLGQFLLSRGRIRTQTLRYALGEQKRTGRLLGDILEEMGVLTRQEIEVEIAAKASETIHGLFEWDDAIFRFKTGAWVDPHPMEVDLSVDEILLEGATRQDDLRRIRAIFPGSSIVLRRTERPIPADLAEDATLFQLLELLDGRRPLAEVILHAHASEYQVLRLLESLHEAGAVEIAGERRDGECCGTLLDGPPADGRARLRRAAEVIPEPDDGDARSTLGSVTRLIQVATQRLAEDNPGDALIILEACYRVRPDEPGLSRLMHRAEAAYLRSLRRGVLPLPGVPSRRAGKASTEGLAPVELFLLGMIDGTISVESMCWIAPLRELEVMRGLHRLLELGLIAIDEPAAVTEPSGAGEPATPATCDLDAS